MRVVVYLLVAVNLLFLAWAAWIDAPPPAPAASPTEALPRLVLTSEDRPDSSSQPGVAAVQSIVGQSSAQSQCISVGPFTDLSQAARSAALLGERGFAPRQRAEQGDAWQGFWVFVGGLETEAAQSTVIQRLERAGIRDARAMPVDEGDRRVSVGLFSERARAEKRADAVQKLGLDPQVTERTQPGTVYWVDIDVGDNERAVPAEGLLSLENAGARLEVRVCPNGQRGST